MLQPKLRPQQQPAVYDPEEHREKRRSRDRELDGRRAALFAADFRQSHWILTVDWALNVKLLEMIG